MLLNAIVDSGKRKKMEKREQKIKGEMMQIERNDHFIDWNESKEGKQNEQQQQNRLHC